MEQFGYFSAARNFSSAALNKSCEPQWPTTVPGVPDELVELFVDLVCGRKVIPPNFPKRQLVASMEQIADFLDGPAVWTEGNSDPGIFNVGLFMYEQGCGPYMLSDKYFWVLLKSYKGEIISYHQLWREEQKRLAEGTVTVYDDEERFTQECHPWLTQLLHSVPNLVLAGGAAINIFVGKPVTTDHDFYIVGKRKFEDVFSEIVDFLDRNQFVIESMIITSWSIKLNCQMENPKLIIDMDIVRLPFESLGHLFATFDLACCEIALTQKGLDSKIPTQERTQNNLCWRVSRRRAIYYEHGYHVLQPSRLNGSDTRIVKHVRRSSDGVWFPGGRKIWASRIARVAREAFLNENLRQFIGFDVHLASVVLPDRNARWFAKHVHTNWSEQEQDQPDRVILTDIERIDVNFPWPTFDSLTTDLMDFPNASNLLWLKRTQVKEFVLHFLAQIELRGDDCPYKLATNVVSALPRNYYGGHD